MKRIDIRQIKSWHLNNCPSDFMDFAGENKINGFKRKHNKNESELSLRKQALFLMLNFRECYITSADAREINKIF
tara:strand:+ start:269 stop:493 length:225 start_codon:yes stop_codon:yes gene_type:complete